MDSEEKTEAGPSAQNASDDLEVTLIEEGDPGPSAETDSGSDEMDAMMDQYLNQMGDQAQSGQMIKVPIVSIHAEHVLADVGQKAEGMIRRDELTDPHGELKVKVGDEVEVVVKGHDGDSGLLLLSHTEARRRASIGKIEAALKENSILEGVIVRAVKGGLIVDIGTTAFLPASQVDLRRVEDFEPWVGRKIEMLVLEFDPGQRRVIVSRRRLLERRQAARRDELMGSLKVGEKIECSVKRLVEFGAFVDLGGVDALIPRGEISWQRMVKPADVLEVGQKLTAEVIEVNRESGKITLSRRRLTPDPWLAAAGKYTTDSEITGQIVSVTNYGAFVRIEEGLDGMIHISDMSWDSGGKRPSDYVAVGQEVRASILKVDIENKRISLSLRQLTADPWDDVERKYPPGTRVKGKITGLTKYGAFLAFDEGVEGMIHVSDFSWEKRIAQPKDVVSKDDEIEAVVISIDRERRRISLGVKQLAESPIELYAMTYPVGSAIEGEVTNVTDFGVFVRLSPTIEGFCHVSQLDRQRVESPSDHFKVGDKFEAEITKIERDSGKISLSRKQQIRKDEKSVLSNYMDHKAGGGANLGELLAKLSLEDDLPKE